MALIKLLAACMVAAGMIAVASDCLKISNEYLEEILLYYDPADMLSSVADVNLDGVDSFEEFIKRLRKQEESGAYPSHKRNLDFFVNLTTPDDCAGYKSRKNFLAIYQGVEVSKKIKNKQILLDFMMRYGKEKFDRCARKALETIETTSKTNAELKGVENFFKRAVFLNENASDEDLYRALMQRTVNDATWNVDWLVSVERKYKSEINNVHVRPFVENCRSFNSNFKPLLDMINFAKSLNPDKEYFEDMNSKKLNEIGRICLERWRNTFEFRKNLERQIGLKQKVLIPIAKIFGA